MPGSGGQLLGPVCYYKRLVAIETETQTLAKLTPKSERIRVHLEKLVSRSTNSLHSVLTKSPIGSLMEVTPRVNSYPGISDPGLLHPDSSGGGGNEPLKGVRMQVGVYEEVCSLVCLLPSVGVVRLHSAEDLVLLESVTNDPPAPTEDTAGFLDH